MLAAMRRSAFRVMPLVAVVAVPLTGTAMAQPVSRDYDGPTSVAMEEDPAVFETPVETDVAEPVPRRRERIRDAPAVEPFTEVKIRPVLDLSITVGMAAPSLALGLWVERSLPLNVPMPGADADVGRFDSVALGRFENGPRIASDVLLAVSLAAPFVYHGIEAGLRRRGWGEVRGRGFLVRYGTDLVVLAQALALNALVTEVLKASIGRPRPYAYLDPDEVDPDRREELIRAQERHDADWSFPSGHTSAAFTASTAGATLLTLDLLGRSPWAIGLAWAGGTAVAVTTGAMRVLAGRHFPSDVVTSALLGAAVGAAVPLAHWRPTRGGDRASRSSRTAGRALAVPRWSVAPLGGPHMGGIQLRGTLP
jgi:membrane-associated phospholipid phosphatase